MGCSTVFVGTPNFHKYKEGLNVTLVIKKFGKQLCGQKIYRLSACSMKAGRKEGLLNKKKCFHS